MVQPESLPTAVKASEFQVQKRVTVIQALKRDDPAYKLCKDLQESGNVPPDMSPPVTPTTDGPKRAWERAFGKFKQKIRQYSGTTTPCECRAYGGQEWQGREVKVRVYSGEKVQL